MSFRVGQRVWVPVPVVPAKKGVYAPEQFQVESVGTLTLHLKGHPDVLIGFAYLAKSDCFDRCQDLFNIVTTRPRSEYPSSKL